MDCIIGLYDGLYIYNLDCPICYIIGLLSGHLGFSLGYVIGLYNLDSRLVGLYMWTVQVIVYLGTGLFGTSTAGFVCIFSGDFGSWKLELTLEFKYAQGPYLVFASVDLGV